MWARRGLHRGPLWLRGVLASLALTVSAGLGGELDWPIYRGDHALTGARDTALAARLALRWSVAIGSGLQSPPVVVGERVLVGAEEGALVCLALADGKTLWRVATDGAVEGPALVIGERVVVGTVSGALHAVALATGETAWSFRAGDKIIGGANLAVLADGTRRLVLGSYDMKLYGLDLASGQPAWVLETENFLNATPAVAEGRVLAGGCDGLLHVVVAQTGVEERAVEIGSYIAAPVAVLAGQAYLGHYGGEVLRVDVASGRIVWRLAPDPAGEPLLAAPAVHGDTLVVGTRGGRLYGLATADGKVRWSYRAGAAIETGAVICGPHVLFGSEDGRLHRLALADGRRVWSYDLGAAISTPPAPTDGGFIVGTADGRLHAFAEERQAPPR